MPDKNSNYSKSSGQASSSNASHSAGIFSFDRPKPHNEDAEIAVLGSMLTDADAASTGLARLNFDGAFYRPAHQMIFNAMVALNPMGEAGIDPVVLADYLQKNHQLEQVGGLNYLRLLMDRVPTSVNIEHYAEIVKQNAVLRRIIATCSDAVMKCYESDGEVAPLLDLIEKEVLEVSQMNQSHDFQHIAPLVDESLKYIAALLKKQPDIQGLATGYDVLDRAMTGGLKPGMLFILAARPAIGKTALALNMATNIALRSGNKTPIGIFSLEMTAQQLMLRLIAAEARVSINNWATETNAPQGDLDAVRNACISLRQTDILIDDTGAIDILELRAKARRMKDQYDIQALFIDYLQLITINSNSNANRENDVARISGALKGLAKELNIPIVCLAQVNRKAEEGDGKPKLSTLRESGAIEQDADVVALLHRKREEQFNRSDNATDGLEAELIIAKNRNGRTCTQKLVFFPQYTRFDAKADSVDDSDVAHSTH
ncbi:MAG: replicative DNA helicase [Victivallales bacterium]|nr:replicative DNA helicase [Victivallales bacterium]